MSLPLGQSTHNNSIEWGTPQEFYDKLNEVWHFTLDPCASDINHKCDKYYTKETNGLIHSWAGETVFVNPPYGREIYDWVKKAHDEWKENNINIVMLIPARTDTKWFHKFIYHQAELEFLRGRLAFEGGIKQQKAPFPSMLVYFKRRSNE